MRPKTRVTMPTVYTHTSPYEALKKIPKGAFCGSGADKEMLCQLLK